jgi:broad specificity phosphatase PhoE
MYLLRHGQSQFNLLFNKTGRDPGIEDPELTPQGVEQAALAARELAQVPLTRIIISPFTRALQTAQPMLALHDVTIEIMHLVRERAYFTCDVGSHPDLLASRFPHHEFTHLPARWWSDGIETAEETVERATAFRALMLERDDSETTLVVSHWAFIIALTGMSLENGELLEYDPRSGAPHIIDWDA